VPAALTLGDWTFAVNPFGPAQEKAEPVGVELTLMGAVGVAQVSVVPVAAKLGGLMSPETVAVAVAEHPVVPLTTVTV
jgi:hypothetical protein